MRYLLAVIVVMAPLAGRAEWTRTDTALEAGYAAALGVDWLQTRGQVSRGGMEMNPILGAHPSHLEVDGFFAASLAIHATIAALLPKPYRTIWQSVTIGIEAHTVYRNARVGVGIHF